MRVGRWIRAVLAVAVVAAFGLFATPTPANADAPVWVEMVWIRCQDETGDPGIGSDEIWVDVNFLPSGSFDDFDKRETKYFYDDGFYHHNVHEMQGDSVYVRVYERDGSPAYPLPNGFESDWDFQGDFYIPRSEVDTGLHENYAFEDGQYIVAYRVTSTHP
jgi:hypothetical protein